MKRLLELIKLSQTWPLLGGLLLCEIRFCFFFTDENDLGQELKKTEATIAMYIIDACLITAVVAMLNFVKLRDLVEDIMSADAEVTLFRIFRTKKRLFCLFKLVLSSFWLQYFMYFAVVLFQIFFDVLEVDQRFVGEDVQRAVNLLKKAGQFYFMVKISGYLWAKMFDDDSCILGKKSVISETRGSQTEASGSISINIEELQRSLGHERIGQSSLASTDVLD